MLKSYEYLTRNLETFLYRILFTMAKLNNNLLTKRQYFGENNRLNGPNLECSTLLYS